MKIKTVLLFIVLLIAVVVVGNSIYGNKLAKEIDAELKAKIADNELPVNIDYAKVKVNPLFSKVKIIGVSVGNPGGEVTFKCEMFDIDIPYKEAQRWLESTEFEEIRSVKIKLVKPEFSGEEAIAFVTFNNLVIDFDGQLTKADFENLKTRFPEKKQELVLSFSGMSVKLPENMYSNPPVSQLLEQFSNVDAGSYALVYNPDSKEIDIQNFSIKSPVVTYKGHTTIKYEGMGFEDFKPESAYMESSLKLEPKNFEWEDENGGKGEFQLDKLVFHNKSTVTFNKQNFPQGDMTLELVNLKVRYDNANNNTGKSMMNFSLDDLDVDRLNINYHLDEEKLSISDSRIKSSLLDAELYADVDVTASNLFNSSINEAKLTVKKLAPDLEKMVNGLEQQLGKELPRENEAIVLELSGKLARPTIKGFEF
ncbi:hypothetical protein [Maribellus sediminis]|uniref:hypothetical protein n=1 Tax=Maribellus sediminis TaxID=2696285 RepID=UPI00143057E3|nr:hypothetical protein [Maribellus sediminis]